MELIVCTNCNDAISRYLRHREECERIEEITDVRLVGDCDHRFAYACRCGAAVETDGYGLSALEAAEHINYCYACCGCDICVKQTTARRG